MSEFFDAMETLEEIDFDKKHVVSKKTLKTLEKVMLAQDDYGFAKYKKPLTPHMNYDWLQMFLEEMADGLKYIQNEIDRKAQVIRLLEISLEIDSRVLVESALQILKTEGTGK
jgi:hypothetical protein